MGKCSTAIARRHFTMEELAAKEAQGEAVPNPDDALCALEQEREQAVQQEKAAAEELEAQNALMNRLQEVLHTERAKLKKSTVLLKRLTVITRSSSLYSIKIIRTALQDRSKNWKKSRNARQKNAGFPRNGKGFVKNCCQSGH